MPELQTSLVHCGKRDVILSQRHYFSIFFLSTIPSLPHLICQLNFLDTAYNTLQTWLSENYTKLGLTAHLSSNNAVQETVQATLIELQAVRTAMLKLKVAAPDRLTPSFIESVIASSLEGLGRMLWHMNTPSFRKQEDFVQECLRYSNKLIAFQAVPVQWATLESCGADQTIRIRRPSDSAANRELYHKVLNSYHPQILISGEALRRLSEVPGNVSSLTAEEI